MITRLHLPSGAYLGLTQREAQRYLLGEMIHAAATDDVDKLGFYRECSDAIMKRTGAQPSTVSSYFVPVDYMVRDLTAASASAGGYLVDAPVGFASGLFAQTLIGTLPLRPLPMNGTGALAATASVATQWLTTEATEASNAEPTFGMRAVVPKTVISTAFVSRQLALQSPGGMQFGEQQIGAKLGEAADTALVDGTGVEGQPHGLLRIAGTTSTIGTSLGWSGVRDMIAACEGYTAGGLQFVLGTTAAKLLRAREKASGNGMVLADGKIDGIPVVVSRAMPADALLLAPWPTVVMATWGALEVTVTPLASPGAFQRGAIGVRLVWTLDFVAEQPSAIGVATSIT